MMRKRLDICVYIYKEREGESVRVIVEIAWLH